MALQNTDLFVVQSQSDKKLYSLKVSDLIAEVEAGGGVIFKGAVDLNNPPASSGVTLPAGNGDFYMVESDAATIDVGWVMQGSETSASQGDRIIYDADDTSWILITTGSDEAGTVTGVVATLPLQSDGNTVEPVVSILTARTATAAGAAGDGNGTAGAVAKLAEAGDVAHDGTGDATAVVTADLLKATNAIVEGLVLSPGGVTTVTTTDANGNSALSISPTAGNVVIELETADDSTYGVVQVASASDITNGTAGASAVVDASQLAAAIQPLPKTAVISVTEGGTDIVSGAVEITTTADATNANEKNVTIGVSNGTFCPYDFSSLTDINA
jgi:hypothetical protein